MVEENPESINFSDLSGRPFEIYLGSILYEVSLGSYKNFIIAAPDSNELRNFLTGVSNLQRRLDLYREGLGDVVIRADLSEDLYRNIPSERLLEAQEYLPRLAFRIQDLQVTELEFIEGSVKGRIRIVLKGVFEFITVTAGAATIAGVSLADFVHQEKDQVYRQSCISFGDIHVGEGDVDINIDIDEPQPAAMQTYMSSPERVEKDIFAQALKEVGISRPRPRPNQ